MVPWKRDWVADTLSLNDTRTDTELTNVFRSCCPSQIPDHFEIAPLPKIIVLYLTSVMQRLPVKEQLRVNTHEDQTRAWTRLN